MITGYEAFGIYNALKLHFTQDSYDYFKYNGKTNVSLSSFENRKDKWHFTKLSKKFNDKEELIFFIVSNLLQNDKFWIGDLLAEDSDVRYLSRKKVLQSLSYFFENDCKKIFEGVANPNELILVNDGDHPKLLKSFMRKEIEIETLWLLDSILNFVPMWKQKIKDDIVWPNHRLKIVKYRDFLPKDKTKFKVILRKIINA
jgi:hypothetical protein